MFASAFPYYVYLMLHAVLVFILVRSKEKRAVVCRGEDSKAAALHFRAVPSDHSITFPPLCHPALQLVSASEHGCAGSLSLAGGNMGGVGRT